MHRSFQGIAMEMALHATGHKFPRLSHVGAAWASEFGPPSAVDIDPPMETPVRVDAPGVDGYGIFIIDLTWTDDRQIKIIEVNGSNAALTSSVRGDDDRRATHMLLSYKNKKKPKGKVAVLMAYQKGLIHVAEFFGRAGIFADKISETQTVRLCDTTENLGSEEVSVICGTIPELSDFISRKGPKLYYRDRPVVFATNANLLAELVRRGLIEKQEKSYQIDFSIYHEGHCTPIIHDKGAQQDIAEGTGIEPLLNKSAYSFDECLSIIKEFHSSRITAVGKMHAGSGGSGIEFFPDNLTEAQVRQKLEELKTSAIQKYGADVEKSMFPIQFFEFVKSTEYSLYGNPHLWDLRLQCLAYPGYVEVTPCVIRLCPKAFNPVTFEREGIVSNLTGRADPASIGRSLRSPAAHRRSQKGTVLESLKIDKDAMNRITEGCARWTEAAWEYCRTNYRA